MNNNYTFVIDSRWPQAQSSAIFLDPSISLTYQEKLPENGVKASPLPVYGGSSWLINDAAVVGRDLAYIVSSCRT